MNYLYTIYIVKLNLIKFLNPNWKRIKWSVKDHPKWFKVNFFLHFVFYNLVTKLFMFHNNLKSLFLPIFIFILLLLLSVTPVTAICHVNSFIFLDNAKFNLKQKWYCKKEAHTRLAMYRGENECIFNYPHLIFPVLLDNDLYFTCWHQVC